MFQDRGLSVDRGCRQASRQAVVGIQVAQDGGAVVRPPPILCKHKGCREIKIGRNANTQHNHSYIQANFTCLTAQKPQEHAQVRDMGCQKCATTRGGGGGGTASACLATLH